MATKTDQTRHKPNKPHRPERRMGVGGSRTLLLLALLNACTTIQATSQTSPPTTPVRAIEIYGQLPLSFEANHGQTDPNVKFLSRGSGYGLFLTPREAVLALRKAKPTPSEAATDETSSESAVLRMRLVGANPNPELSGETTLPGKVNYFIGNDLTQWRTNVPTYAQAVYTNVYPGIDLVYYGNQGQLEYDFVVAPGHDPASITMAFQGVDRLELDATGDLVLQTSGGTIRQRRPVIYQELEGERQEIVGNYLLKSDDQVSFQVAAFDVTKPLIIDPILVFSTYLGGNGDDAGLDIAVDAAGNSYVTGDTRSTDFPTADALQPAFGGEEEPVQFRPVGDAFVSKFDATGTALIYSTYLGGSGNDAGRGLAIDAEGNAYVAGLTSSTDFPTAAPLQPMNGGQFDAFVAKLNPTGAALIYSTYLGGSSDDTSSFQSQSNIAVDAEGSAYVTGGTSSPDFPTTAGAFQTVRAGPSDGFAAKLHPTGSALVYSSYFGGSSFDRGDALTVDTSGNVYVAGTTFSSDFPTTAGAFQTACGFGDVIVTKLNPTGSAMVYSTCLGGSDFDFGGPIALDASHNAYVTGRTVSLDFPTATPLQRANGGDSDAFVTKVNPEGSDLVYSTYLGGSEFDGPSDIAVDVAGNAYVTGGTSSSDFPTQNPLQPAFGGGGDAFVAQLTADGSALSFATYLGGSGPDSAQGIAVDALGNAFVAGVTFDTNDFPTVNPLQPVRGGGRTDAFVVKIDPLRENLNELFARLGPRDVATAFSSIPCGGASAGTFTITATFTGTSADTLSNLLLTVRTLTGGNVLCNANGGPGGTGSQLTVPLEGDLADGLLSPGESFGVEFLIGLESLNRYWFFVDVYGTVTN